MVDNNHKKVAWLIVAILVGLSVFQVLLIFGAPLGKFAWGGQNEVLPTCYRIGSVVSIAIYVFTGWILMSKAEIGRLKSNRFINVASWVLAGYFCLGILMNLASRSNSERLVMVPVVTMLALASLYLAKKHE